MQFINNDSCDVGRKVVHKDSPPLPCGNVGTNRVVYDDGGNGEPLALHLCDEHLPELAPSDQQMEMEGMCMAGRQLTGLKNWMLPCPNKFTEIVHVLGPDGGFIFELCDPHRAQLPAQPML